MFERRSLKLPITLGVVMIVLLVTLTVGWVLLTAFILWQHGNDALFWTLLAVGTLFLVIVLVGVVIYLTLSIKSINLNQRQSNFVDSVTHELKSPIASLKLYLQTLTRQPVSDDERSNFHSMMLDDVERLDQLINHLLDAARLQRISQTRETSELRLDEILRECAHAVCTAHHISPEAVKLNTVPCVIVAPREDLLILFRNLMDNAVKYAGDPPSIRIELMMNKEGEPVVQIEDNGKGIPANLRRRIFGRFVRLGHELERERPGTGLGLYLVRSVVRRLRARIRVKDGDRGVGTLFEVTLPASCVQMPTTEPRADEAA
jgi:signal transduction histidine kinase